MKTATITTPVSRYQFDELVNRFGDHARRVGTTVVVTLNHYADERVEAVFRAIAKEHGYEFVIA